MYAVIQAGGRQYKVAPGDVIRVDYFEAPAGAEVTFDRVLLASDGAVKIGRPFLDGATVTGEVVDQTRGPKHIIFKRRRRHTYKKKRGFRAQITAVRISAVNA
jgi:large subunit ribosomal protein L21